MPRKTKITELQNEDGTVVIQKDVQPEIPTVSTTAVKAKVKREMTEAQRLNMLKMIEANKVKWEAKRKEKEDGETKAKADKRAKEEELINAGTHIRVKVLPKKVYKPRAKAIPAEETEEEEEEEEKPVFQKKPVKRSQKAPPPSDEETTETETDGEEYKNQKRVVRREVKKNLKALKKIDEVLEQSSGNPYLAYLSQRWK